MSEVTWAQPVKQYKDAHGDEWWPKIDGSGEIQAAVYGRRSDGTQTEPLGPYRVFNGYVFKMVVLNADASEEMKQAAIARAMKELEVKGLLPEAVTVKEGDMMKDGF